MKTKLFIAAVITLLSFNVFAEGKEGGGGDYTESVINDIRVDIEKWIAEGGAKNLKLSVPYQTYVQRMDQVLESGNVIIGSISTAEESTTSDPDLKLTIDGQPKTCRGSRWAKDSRYHILCNIERFAATPENERYPLIHHEYAGLARLEQNLGAASDYQISRQLSGFLDMTEILKLTVRPARAQRRPNGCFNQGSMTCVEHDGLVEGQEFTLARPLSLSTIRPTFFVHGTRMAMDKVLLQEGNPYCGIEFSTRRVDGVLEQVIPKSLPIENGHVTIPATSEPYFVSDLGWYTPDVHLRSLIDDENISISVTCGAVVNGQLIEAKGTSLVQFMAALNGVFTSVP